MPRRCRLPTGMPPTSSRGCRAQGADRREPGRYGVDVGARREQSLDGSGLLIAGRARKGDHDRVDLGLGHRPGQAGDRPEQGQREPASLVAVRWSGRCRRSRPAAGPARVGRAGSARAAGRSSRCRRPAPAFGAAPRGATRGFRRRRGCARAPGRRGRAHEGRSGRAGADQDRGGSGHGHEQPGQVLDDREHQPGPVQVGGPGDQHGGPAATTTVRGESSVASQARGDHGGGVREGHTGPIVPSHGIRRPREQPQSSAQDQLCGRTPRTRRCRHPSLAGPGCPAR